MEQQILIGSAIKAVGDNRFRGHLVPFGSVDERDFHGQYFDNQTDFELDGKGALPMLFHHGLDPNLKARVLGKADKRGIDEVGLWIEFYMNMADEYERAVTEAMKTGAFKLSSGSMVHQRKFDDQGHIYYWPLYEASITPIPADTSFKTRIQPIEAIKSISYSFNLDNTQSSSPTTKEVSMIKCDEKTLLDWRDNGVITDPVYLKAVKSGELEESDVIDTLTEVSTKFKALNDPVPPEPTEEPEADDEADTGSPDVDGAVKAAVAPLQKQLTDAADLIKQQGAELSALKTKLQKIEETPPQPGTKSQGTGGDEPAKSSMDIWSEKYGKGGNA